MNPISAMDEKALRQLFRDWNSLKLLGEQPFSAMKIVQARQQSAGYAGTNVGRGMALREVVLQAVEALKPEAGAPRPEDKRWRAYIILSEQFLSGRSPEWVQAELHVAKGTYYGEQKRALQRLADQLQQEETACCMAEPGALPLPGGPVGQPAIFMAPARPAHALVGRAALIQHLKQHLLNGSDRAITALNGLPGVGKTTLAIELAYDADIQAHFQDGILWCGLGRQPDILSLLGNWATAVGTPPEKLTGCSDPAERAALIRATIGLRRMLLVIDDAWQIEAALFFKAGGPNCAHLVTTRFVDLALDFAGGQVTPVHELSAEDGLSLLTQVSPHAVETDPNRARDLVQSVGSLPLALILVGRYLQKHSFSPQQRRLREALERLKAAENRLQLAQPQPPVETHPGLPAGTPLSLQAVIGLSDSALDPAAHQALLDLSVFPAKPNTFSEQAALAVTAAPAEILDTLVDRGLVECVDTDRYTLHQTIADYAALQGGGQSAARLVAAFVEFVEQHQIDFAALDLEFANILAACAAAQRPGCSQALVRLADGLFYYLDIRGRFQVCQQLLSRAYAAAQAAGDQGGQAQMSYRLGGLATKRANFQEAQAYLQQSLALARTTHLRGCEADTLFELSLACMYAGDFRLGKTYAEQSIEIYRQLDRPQDYGFALNALGFALGELCDYPQTQQVLERALAVCRASGNRRGEGWAHFNLSVNAVPQGNFTRAKEHADRCQEIYLELGDRRGVGWLLYHYGRIFRQMGDFKTAQAYFEQGLEILNEIGDGMGSGFAMHNLGLVLGELGGAAAAHRTILQALDLFLKTGCWTGAYQCYHSLGMLHRKQGDFSSALHHLERARQGRQAIGYRRGESTTLANLGRVYSYLGEAQNALQNGRQAVEIAQEIGALPTQAYTLTLLGQTLVEQEHLEEAVPIYQQAVTLRQLLGQPHLAAEPLAGLAAVAQLQGDTAQARRWVKEILDGLPGFDLRGGPLPALAGCDQPDQVYRVCMQVTALQ